MSQRRPTYTHVIQRYFPFRGGSERYFQAFSERFARDGARVQVVTSDAWDLEYFWDPRRKRIGPDNEVHNGVAIERVPVQHLPLATISHRAIRRLMAESCRAPFPGREALLTQGSRFGPWLPALDRALERSGRPDLVNSANIALESMIAAAERHARRCDVPHVVTPFLHLGAPNDARVRRYYTMPHQIGLLQRADAVMALTHMEADFLLNSGVDETKLHVVGAGIDVDAVTGGDAASIRDRLDIHGPIVLALGAAAYDKGTIHLVRAITTLRRGGTDPQLVIAGPMMSDVEQVLTSLSSAEREGIRALGFVSDEERRDLLAAATILALPSRTESFGLVFMEAWANGLPVIGAKAGAIPAVVTDGSDGILIDFGDVPGLARAIEQLIDSPALASGLGESGRNKVVSEEQWFRRVRAMYREVLGGEQNIGADDQALGAADEPVGARNAL